MYQLPIIRCGTIIAFGAYRVNNQTVTSYRVDYLLFRLLGQKFIIMQLTEN